MTAFTLKSLRRACYPFPVYVARLHDGEVASISFYSETGKPLDIERGRRLVELFWRRPVFDWFVQHDGKVVAQGRAWDTPAVVPTKKARVSVAELRKEVEQWQSIASRLIQAWPEDPITASNNPLVKEVMDRLVA